MGNLGSRVTKLIAEDAYQGTKRGIESYCRGWIDRKYSDTTSKVNLVGGFALFGCGLFYPYESVIVGAVGLFGVALWAVGTWIPYGTSSLANYVREEINKIQDGD